MTTSSLSRFIEAQADPHSGYEVALKELQAGRKTSHWIWYIFPQLAELGRSSTAKFYGLSGLKETGDYLRHSVLGSRIEIATAVVREKLEQSITLNELMGSAVDSAKLISSLTLFEAALNRFNENDQPLDYATFSVNVSAVLRITEQQGFPRCAFTLAEMKASP